ncbi:hypothetical protein [Streptomyces qinglanensis]|uniref:hypothetical protein n=1 Tax=Streptomyces qinglanensis TaxID=943816 RepID=UPI003D74565E
MERRAFTPSRSRPHRWCGVLRRGAALLTLPGLLLAGATGGLTVRLLLAATGTILLASSVLLHAPGHRAGARALAPHPGWTAAAAAAHYALDLAACGEAAAAHTAAATVLAWIVVHTLTHHRAVQPVRDRGPAA